MRLHFFPARRCHLCLAGVALRIRRFKPLSPVAPVKEPLRLLVIIGERDRAKTLIATRADSWIWHLDLNIVSLPPRTLRRASSHNRKANFTPLTRIAPACQKSILLAGH